MAKPSINEYPMSLLPHYNAFPAASKCNCHEITSAYTATPRIKEAHYFARVVKYDIGHHTLRTSNPIELSFSVLKV